GFEKIRFDELARSRELGPRTRAHALSLWKPGSDEERLTLCERAVALDPESAPRRYELADTLRALGRKDEALASYRKALELLNRKLTGHIHYFDLCQGAISDLERSAR